MQIIKNFKTWWKTAKPNGILFFFQALLNILSGAIIIYSSVPLAKSISLLTISAYQSALDWILIYFILNISAYVLKGINYHLNSAQFKHIYYVVQQKLFNKVFLIKDDEFRFTSKEKILNTITNNLTSLYSLTENLCYRLSIFIQAIITFSIIVSINLYVGSIIILISIIIFFLTKLINKFIAKQTISFQANVDLITENYSNIMSGLQLSNDLELQSTLKEKYFTNVRKTTKNFSYKKFLQSLRDNLLSIIYLVVVLFLTIFLVKLLSLNILTITTYLVITPYLTLAVSQSIDFFSFTNDIAETNISVLRVNTILNMEEADLIEFGKNSQDNINGTICFSNVSFLGTACQNNIIPDINNFSLNINPKNKILIYGEKDCGKRAIFYMLRRVIRPTQGTITFDNINIYDFEKATYKHNLSYTTSKPYFFNDTILENLKIIESNKRKIFEYAKILNIHQTILNLPNGYQTNLTKEPNVLNSTQKFLLSLLRALLTDSEIIVIYELPIGINFKEIEEIKKTISKLKNKTVIMFMSNNDLKDICDQTYFVKNSNLFFENTKHNQ